MDNGQRDADRSHPLLPLAMLSPEEWGPGGRLGLGEGLTEALYLSYQLSIAGLLTSMLVSLDTVA